MAGGLRSGVSQDDPAVLREDEVGPLAVAILDGRVAAVGRERDVQAQVIGQGMDVGGLPRLDAAGGTVTPGLLDPHTHLLFRGTRERELALRQQGRAYLDILAGGGGILATVEATRAASDEDLLDHGRRWLDRMLASGVTTAEVKSGYGLDVATELRLLGLYRRLGSEGPVELVPTFLGAHAVPAEYHERAGDTDDYVTDVIERQLPAAASQGIARFCDVFCEPGVFDLTASRLILKAARALGLRLRLHADELHDSSGAALAAELGATSADHLGAVSAAGIEALGRAADEGQPVVATLLPATTLYLMRERHAPARKLIDRGVPVALGTDFNPGTSPTASLPLVMSLACILLHMTAAEALAAVTINAAHALALGDTHGALAAGRVGDVLIWSVPRHELIPYWIGANLVQAVVKRGHVVSVKPRAGA
ncbi:imidazolonepropionase [soil metagenome]